MNTQEGLAEVYSGGGGVPHVARCRTDMAQDENRPNRERMPFHPLAFQLGDPMLQS